MSARRLLIAFVLTISGYVFSQIIKFEYDRSLPDARIDVSQVYFTQETLVSPPEEGSYGRPLQLPYNWRQDERDTRADQGTGWYTAVVKLNVPPNRLWVVYFPNISANSSIFLNNEILGRGLRLDEGIGQMNQRALYLNIPNGMLRSGENVLQINLQSGNSYFYGSIEPFHLGPESAFRAVYSQQKFFETTLVKYIGMLLFFAALGNGLIWKLRKQESLYGWFALGCLLWSAHILTHFLPKASLTITHLEFLFRYITITWFTAILVVIVNRYQQATRNAERILFLIAALISVSLVILPERLVFLVSNYLVGMYALSMIAYSFFRMVWVSRQTAIVSDYFVALSFSILFFLSINDLISTLSPDARKYTGMTVHYGAPLFVLVLSWKLIQDFVNARADVEALNQTLEERVEQKSQELQQNFAQIKEMEHREVLAHERDRLVMDMHDGLGGQLVAAVSMLDTDKADRSAVSSVLKDALTDLRLMIDALDPVYDNIALVLGGYRQQLEKSLQGTNIRLTWKVGVMESNRNINPHAILQILRILQEAVANSLKHANASEITVQAGADAGQQYIRISDNGTGMNNKNHPGRGIKHMRRRADSIGADLTICSDTNGVTVTIAFSI